MQGGSSRGRELSDLPPTPAHALSSLLLGEPRGGRVSGFEELEQLRRSLRWHVGCTLGTQLGIATAQDPKESLGQSLSARCVITLESVGRKNVPLPCGFFCLD